MPSITRTRATAVPRSRIAEMARDPIGSTARPTRRRGAGRRLAAGARRLPGPGNAAEEAEEIALGAQDERGAVAVERVAIGLQRAVEGEEFLILAERVGI